MFWFGLGAMSLVVAILAAVFFIIYVVFYLIGEFISDMCE